MLESVNKNKKYGKNSIALFEIGTVFDKHRDENINIAFVFSGEKDYANIINHGKPEDVDFYDFARKISNIIGEFDLELQPIKSKLCNPYECALIKQNGIILGFIFALHANVEKDFDIDRTYICELDFSKLAWKSTIVNSYSSFQAISRDLSLLVPKDMPYLKISGFIKGLDIENLVGFSVVDVYEDKSLGDKVSLSIKFNFQSNEKTLKDEDIAIQIDKILESLKQEFNIEIR
jgi:phenylalanyl-tRNA synthetase beta chain